MRFEVQGRNTEAEDFEITDLRVLKTQNTRSIIALGIFGVSVLFLLGSAIYGLIAGNFGFLETVFTYTQAPLGAITGYYFGVKNG